MDTRGEARLHPRIAEFAFLWEDSGWTLVTTDGRSALPVHSTSGALLIEDDELAAAVAAEAIRRGVPLVREAPAPPHDPIADARREHEGKRVEKDRRRN